MSPKYWLPFVLCAEAVLVAVVAFPFVHHYWRGVECGREAATAIARAAGSDLFEKSDCECTFWGPICEIWCKANNEHVTYWVYECHPPQALCAVSARSPALQGVPCCKWADCTGGAAK